MVLDRNGIVSQIFSGGFIDERSKTAETMNAKQGYCGRGSCTSKLLPIANPKRFDFHKFVSLN